MRSEGAVGMKIQANSTEKGVSTNGLFGAKGPGDAGSHGELSYRQRLRLIAEAGGSYYAPIAMGFTRVGWKNRGA